MKRCFLVATALSLSSCALVEPYKAGVGLYAKSIYDCPDNAAQSAGPNALRCTLQKSVETQKNYLDNAGEHELARSLAGSAMLAGSAYGLLLGVSEGIAPANAGDQIAAIGAGTAALFGVTTLLTSPRRQDVYIAGAHAISCVQLASSPYLLSEEDYIRLSIVVSDFDRNSIRPILNSITGAATALQNDARLKPEIDQVNNAVMLLRAARSEFGNQEGTRLLLSAVANLNSKLDLSDVVGAIRTAPAAARKNATQEQKNKIEAALKSIESIPADSADPHTLRVAALKEIVDATSQLDAPNPINQEAAQALSKERSRREIERTSELIEKVVNGRALPARISAAESALEAYLQQRIGAAGDDAQTYTSAMQAAAEKTIAAAGQAYDRGLALKGEIESGAPERAMVALRRIDIAVARELRRAQPDLSSILAIQGNLAGLAGRIAPGFLPAPQAGEASKAGLHAGRAKTDIAASEAQKLRAALLALRTDILIINSTADAVEKRIKQAGDINECGFDPVNLALRTTPEALSFTEGEATSKAFVVEEGEAPFVAAFAGNATGLNVDFDPPFGRIATVISDTSIKPGDYILVVMEKSGASKQVTVTVTPKSAGGGNGADNDTSKSNDQVQPAPDVYTEAAYVAEPVIVKAAKRAINLAGFGGALGEAPGAETGAFNQKTVDALKTLQKKHNIVDAAGEGTGVLDGKTMIQAVRTELLLKPVQRTVEPNTDWGAAQIRLAEEFLVDKAQDYPSCKARPANETGTPAGTVKIDGAIDEGERPCLWEFQLSFALHKQRAIPSPELTGVLDSQTVVAFESVMPISGAGN